MGALHARILSGPERQVGAGMVLGGVCITGLVGVCLAHFPVLRVWSRDGLVAAVVVAVVAAGYGLGGWFGARAVARRGSGVIRSALPWGLTAGAMFVVSMLAEYLVSPENCPVTVNEVTLFGSFFVLLFGAGVAGTRAAGRVSAGALTGLWAALIASELWVLALFAVYLAFLGTPQETRFLEVDQVLADFERSRQADLRAFIFGDYAGGAFFHSVLGVFLGLVLGGLGGLVTLPFVKPRVP